MPVSGAVDAVVGRFVVGWAHDPEDEARRIKLDVELNGQLVASGVADLPRSDLMAAGLGDGNHGFRIELPALLLPGSDHVLAIRAPSDRMLLPLARDFNVRDNGDNSGRPVIVRLPSSRPAAADGDLATSDSAATPTAKALLGTEGWLFELRRKEMMEALLGQRQIMPAQIDFHRRRLVRIADRLRSLGVQYVVAVLPDKANLYREYLPAELNGALEDRAVTLVAGGLRDVNQVELLDLLPALRDARRHGQLTPRTGIGLTWLGAFHAYRAVAKELAKGLPGIEPHPPEAIALGSAVELRNSLTGRPRVALMSGEQVPVAVGSDAVETEPDLASGELRATYAPMSAELQSGLDRGSTLLECEDPDVQSTAIIVHNGRGGRLASLLAEHFSSTLVAVARELPYSAIERESPAVVVQVEDEWRFCG
jgi:hypothetical protein